jgi:hypothetical protein
MHLELSAVLGMQGIPEGIPLHFTRRRVPDALGELLESNSHRKARNTINRIGQAPLINCNF